MLEVSALAAVYPLQPLHLSCPTSLLAGHVGSVRPPERAGKWGGAAGQMLRFPTLYSEEQLVEAKAKLRHLQKELWAAAEAAAAEHRTHQHPQA